MDLSSLPIEIQWKMLLDLNPKDLRNACATSTYYREICNTDSFWKIKVVRDFGEDTVYDTSLSAK
jgi:hypothetical protein